MSVESGDRNALDTNVEPPSPTTPAGSSSNISCTPDVGGLVLSDISPITVRCPSGYTPREGRSAVPVAGRFTSETELVEAFCVTADKAPVAHKEALVDGTTSSIDFDTSAVVAFAYDASEGAPTLYRRGDDLWLKVMQTECRGAATTSSTQLASIVFVIPKASKVNEQTCSRACP